MRYLEVKYIGEWLEVLIKLLKLVGNLIYVYTLLLSYSLYYKIEDYFIVRNRDDIKEPMSDPSDFMRDDDWEGSRR